MIITIIKTIFILTIGCVLLAEALLIITSGSFDNFLYILILTPFTVFIGPLTILTLIYAFIYSRYKDKTSQKNRIIKFIIATAMAIVVWYLVEIFDWKSDITQWTPHLIKERISKSEMGVGVIIFIPLCLVTSLIFDQFKEKRQG